MDFVTDFPLSQGYNAIFVCVNCLTKYTKLILCFMGADLLKAEKVTLLSLENVAQYFGILNSVVYDKNPRFTGDFWQSLWKLLG